MKSIKAIIGDRETVVVDPLLSIVAVAQRMAAHNIGAVPGGGSPMSAFVEEPQAEAQVAVAAPPERPSIPPVPWCPYTDVGNAKRLVAKHGHSVRYCPAWKKWLVWDGRRWRVDKNGAIERRAKKTIEQFLKAAFQIDDIDMIF